MKRLLILTFTSLLLLSQNGFPQKVTSENERLLSFRQKEILKQNSYFKNVKLTSIGPSIMGGRVVDIDVNEDNPAEFYAAYASGGLWKTINNGLTFTPLFDNAPNIIMGDIAVDWKHGEIIWAGTGENTSSRSSYAGCGIFKSTDKGKSFKYMGLGETQRIGRIVISPRNPDIVWVAALGHLYSPNPDRGVYKTTDGGITWKKTLFIDDTTGAVDLTIDPKNPDILYAASWYKYRKPNMLKESGSQSAIYKSTDGGNNWQKITGSGSGFLTGDNTGRIGIAVSPQNPDYLYALVDNQNRRPKQETENKTDGKALTKEKLLVMSKDEFLKLEPAAINHYLQEKDFPAKYNAKKVIELVKENKITPQDIANFFDDSEDDDQSTPVIGAEVYRSTNGGMTWQKTNSSYLEAMYYSYGYYFGNVRIDPQDFNRIYILGVNILFSTDGGVTFAKIQDKNLHMDHHAFWINPQKQGYIISGNDGGINISYDNGENWFKVTYPSVGQFYSVAIDNETPYNVYGGMQDNGVWYGPSTYSPDQSWLESGQYPYQGLVGGDGMQVQIDTTNKSTIYVGYQYGYYYRFDKRTGKSFLVRPMHQLGEPKLRYNWQTPIMLSSFNSDFLFFGANKLFRSFNKGNDFEAISHDLTRGKPSGNVAFGTISTIDESPLKFGVLYTGSDDGLAYVSKDGGASWTKIFDTPYYISRIVASQHENDAVYITLNGYRFDDFNSYIYKSTNYGKSWQQIGLNLPKEPVNVLREDPLNPNVLFAGTDAGLYASIDKGVTFMPLFNSMPDVPVHDIAISRRESELIAATHGRSLYKADIRYIEKLTGDVLKKQLYVFPLDNITYSPNWGHKAYSWGEPHVPEMEIVYYSSINKSGLLEVKLENGVTIYKRELKADQGLNYFNYDLSIDSALVNSYKDNLYSNKRKIEDREKEVVLNKADNGKYYLLPGKYTVEINAGGTTVKEELEIKQRKQRIRE